MSVPERWFVGVDGGGAKTVAVVTDAAVSVLGVGRAGASNYHAVGIDGAVCAIEAAITQAFDDLPVTPPAPQRIYLGLAGAGRDADRTDLETALRPRWPGSSLEVDHDAAIALYAGTGGKPGLLLSAGSGSIAFGVAVDGSRARADGWGPLLGDNGGGYALGRAALRAVMSAFDGKGAATSLTAAILSSLSLEAPPDLVRWAYAPERRNDEITALAQLVCTAAEDGDAVADALVAEAAGALVECAAAVHDALHFIPPVTAVVAGSLLTRSAAYRTAVERQLARQLPSVCLSREQRPPVAGALLMAGRDESGFAARLLAYLDADLKSPAGMHSRLA